MSNPPLEGNSDNTNVPGIKGTNTAKGGAGVLGESDQWEGVSGLSNGQAAGVAGYNNGPLRETGPGLLGESRYSEGVHGVSHSKMAGVAGFNYSPSVSG